jgi:quercetin dioxygenase-like cupin family protein
MRIGMRVSTRRLDWAATHQPRDFALFVALAATLSLIACARSSQVSSAVAAPASNARVASTTVRVPGACETQRTGPADAVGCYLAGKEQLGAAPATPLFWHLDSYPTRAAAEAARHGRGTVTEAHGRVWLFTIADAEWRPEGGQRVARVGPLPLTPRRRYSAHYIEGVIPPGARTPAHRHAGPEAWYVLEGTNCLETPDGVRTASAGESLIVPEGPPMVLTGVGSTIRRSLALVVHDSAQPWTIVTSGWTPKGACPR